MQDVFMGHLPSQMCRGERRARVRMALASSSPTKASLAGSNVTLRPSIHAIAAAWQATCEERMTFAFAAVRAR